MFLVGSRLLFGSPFSLARTGHVLSGSPFSLARTRSRARVSQARDLITCSLSGSYYVESEALISVFLADLLYQLISIRLFVPDCHTRQHAADSESDMGSFIVHSLLCGDIGVCQRNKMIYFIPMLSRG